MKPYAIFHYKIDSKHLFVFAHECSSEYYDFIDEFGSPWITKETTAECIEYIKTW